MSTKHVCAEVYHVSLRRDTGLSEVLSVLVYDSYILCDTRFMPSNSKLIFEDVTLIRFLSLLRKCAS